MMIARLPIPTPVEVRQLGQKHHGWNGNAAIRLLLCSKENTHQLVQNASIVDGCELGIMRQTPLQNLEPKPGSSKDVHNRHHHLFLDGHVVKP